MELTRQAPHFKITLCIQTTIDSLTLDTNGLSVATVHVRDGSGGRGLV